ncbi:MAG: sigma-54-dependent Fis family transcriptional regulator [Bdellovibrionales bacterium]|nr:sigma-54-dependent Fis family transcriptional regulator [Bdellovibrionales bacterium]
MTRKSILVCDDEVSIRKVLQKALEREGYQVTTVKSVEEGKAVGREKAFDLLISDLVLLDGNGLELVRELRHIQKDVASIVITGNATVESAIEATKQGVFHYVTKPFDIDEVLVLVAKALQHERLAQENKQLKQALHRKYNFENFVGDSAVMMTVFQTIEKVADTNSTVLISGESGTGKELVARALHYNSDRADKLFVPVNCSAIPAGLLESELFGHMRGAFTGATANRVGRFQAADGGTLFLDEVGDMQPDLQVKLLRALQNRQVEPVGSVKPIDIDTRIVAATNVDLEQAVVERKFREDLFYRLNVIPIHMPALRDRKGDIPLLVNHFLAHFNEEKGCDVAIAGEEVMHAIMAYDWPGNVRELENLVQRLVILKRNGAIETKDLPPKLFGARAAQAGAAAAGAVDMDTILRFDLPDGGLDFKSVINQIEDHLLKQALHRTGGNKNKASELLRMNRTTLVEKLKKKQLQV